MDLPHPEQGKGGDVVDVAVLVAVWTPPTPPLDAVLPLVNRRSSIGLVLLPAPPPLSIQSKLAV